jgi:hypothetical protein
MPKRRSPKTSDNAVNFLCKGAKAWQECKRKCGEVAMAKLFGVGVGWAQCAHSKYFKAPRKIEIPPKQPTVPRFFSIHIPQIPTPSKDFV